MSENNLREEFEKEVSQLQNEGVLSPEYRRRKLIMYAIRTTIAIILYIVLWKYQWVRWSLWAYVPLNLLGLFMIVGSGHFLNKKIEKTRQKIEDAESDIASE